MYDHMGSYNYLSSKSYSTLSHSVHYNAER